MKNLLARRGRDHLLPLMMLSFALVLGTVLALTWALPANAWMDWQGMDSHGYYGIKGGVNSFDSQKVDTFVRQVDFDSKAGYDVDGVLGLYLNPNIRLEAELGYANADLNEAKLRGFVLDGSSGELQTITGMANVYYDFFSTCRLTPFVGGGVGVADVRLHRYKVNGATLVDDDNAAFAYQLMAGLKYHLTPHMAATLEYRYFGTSGVDIHSTTYDKTSLSVNSQNVLGGLEFRF